MTPISPLISTDVLASRLGEADLRIVDVRWYLGRPGAGREAYLAGHIPGAILLDLDADLSATDGRGPGRHPLPSPATFTRHLGEHGIGTEDFVVAYDDVGGWVAARLWWMLENLGHRRVAVLDGGIGAWSAAGFALTTEVPNLSPARLELADRWTNTIDRDELRARLGSVILLDARAAPRYRGEVEPVDPVAGHIPTAVNVPIQENLEAGGRFLPAAELAARFRELGAGGSGEVVTSCGSGTSACHHSLAMRVAGLPDPILYVGSWSDWSRAGYPVATGPEPGAPPD
ncbi:MAG TPA: sulfurtransferase [Candidatus Limnocylindrales bacterium]|jgi:thiosulfate/3-mercaptopyruvate sulfurtransferase